MTNEKMFTMSMFPLTQFTAFGQIAVKALNSGDEISFVNFNETILVDFSMATVFIITSIVMGILFIFFLYMIPLSIAVDEENPLKWYYPCVCGCLRNRRTNLNFIEDENDNEIETPLLA